MRMHIWKTSDFIGPPDKPVGINVKGVEHKDEVPLCYSYDHVRPPIGRVFDIQTTDLNEMTCAVEFFKEGRDAEFFNGLVLDDKGYLSAVDKETNAIGPRFRLGIYAYKIEFETDEDGEKTCVSSCTMPQVSLIPEPAWPYSEPDANRGANPRANLSKEATDG